MPAVFRPLRSAISLAMLGLALWAAFAVELGDKTFAEHVDTISGTPEAQELIQDTRATINPALVEVRDRVLGEYVEAPTWIPDEDPTLASGGVLEHRESRARPAPVESQAGASEPALPGRKAARAGPPRGAQPETKTGLGALWEPEPTDAPIYATSPATSPEPSPSQPAKTGFEPALPGRR
jgi:hypothetical protein